METRRYLTFALVMMVFMFAWNTLGPKMFPGMFPVANQQVVNKDKDKEDNNKEKKIPKKEGDDNKKEHPEKEPVPAEGATVAELKAKLNAKPKEVILGSLDVESGFFIQATISSRGAVINRVELNDPRYKELKYKKPILPVKVIGNKTGKSLLRTFGVTVEEFNEQLVGLLPSQKETDWLNAISWEIVPGLQSDSAVTFRALSPDKLTEVTKKFALKKFEDGRVSNEREQRDSDATGYTVEVTLSFKNLGKEEREIKYILQGPVGLPLENKAHTREYRTVKWGIIEEDGDLYDSYETAKNIAKSSKEAEDTTDPLQTPIQYIGVDVQYFSALISPLDTRPAKDRIIDPWFESAKPVLINEDIKEPVYSDVSAQLHSSPLTLPADGETVTHSFAMYSGPKRKTLLAPQPFSAEESLGLGWFSMISKGMLAVLKFLHNTLHFHYGIAIICLTIMVRGMMFPLSRKQAASAMKMKEFQPKLTALKEKYGDDKEKMAKAQMELFRKHGYNPLAGCLPMIIQLPIFIGLYRMLNTAVDLRRVPFLWFDNLAAPDQLFKMGYKLPFLGDDFNLLPILTVILFYAQQKVMAPAATTPEQAQQQKMMSFMMIFMGFLFYHVPAGLCVYFIASSLWGMTERKLLAWWEEKHPKPVLVDGPSESSSSGGSHGKEETKEKGFFGRLLDIADQAANEAKAKKAKEAKENNGQSNNKKNSKKRKKR